MKSIVNASVLALLVLLGVAAAQETHEREAQGSQTPQYWQHNEKLKQWQPMNMASPPESPSHQSQEQPQLGQLIGSIVGSNYAQPSQPPQKPQHQPPHSQKPSHPQQQSLIQLPGGAYPASGHPAPAHPAPAHPAPAHPAPAHPAPAHPAPVAVPASGYPVPVPVVPLAPYAIQQPGISSYGEPIIENLIGGIPFDCRGLPTGPVRDNRFCDIFHACVFGQQRKTYACPYVGERTYFEPTTQRCEFIRKNPHGCSLNAYYH